jgi:DNA end-binding protein Ku
MARKSAKKPRWRASWKGSLRFGLVSINVEAVNARSPDEGDIHFHQLHAECHHRIHYEKVCPVHGKVEQNEIVSGYEYQRGKYVEVDPEELDALRSKNEKAFVIDAFVDYGELNPLFLDGRMYYLIASNAEATEAYRVLTAALGKDNQWGIGHLVMSGKDQIAAVKVQGKVLLMAMLNYESELRDSRDFEPAESKLPARQVSLAVDLIESWSEKRFNFHQYEDRYRNRVAELIEKKISGKDTVVAEDEEEESPVINLMEALRKSVRAKSGHRFKNSSKHRKKILRKKKGA